MNEPLTIKVKYHVDQPELRQINIGDAIDVRAANDVSLKYMEHTNIPLGFSCQLPEGYFAILLPRSSTFKKYGIVQANSIGLIDSSYCGNDDEWAMPVVSFRHEACIPKGERIAQFVLLPKMPTVRFETVDDLNNDNRGGFGSTGVE